MILGRDKGALVIYLPHGASSGAGKIIKNLLIINVWGRCGRCGRLKTNHGNNKIKKIINWNIRTALFFYYNYFYN